jgi:transposase
LLGLKRQSTSSTAWNRPVTELTAAVGERGYDGGKKIKGRKRHIVVDALGLPLAVTVTAANVHDLKGGYRVLRQVKNFLGWFSFEKLYADGTYQAASFHKWVVGTSRKGTFSHSGRKRLRGACRRPRLSGQGVAAPVHGRGGVDRATLYRLRAEAAQ